MDRSFESFVHDLNNLLVGIEGYCHLLSEEDELPIEAKQYVSSVLKLIDRATLISKSFQRQKGLSQKGLNGTDSPLIEEECSVDELRILVIDDDSHVREVVRKTLEAAGCFVMTASDGQEGLDRFSDGYFHCVLLDLHMPVMSGNLVFARLKAIDPDLPIIVMSALISDDRIVHFSDNAVTRFIQKPFSKEALLSSIALVHGSKDLECKHAENG